MTTPNRVPAARTGETGSISRACLPFLGTFILLGLLAGLAELVILWGLREYDTSACLISEIATPAQRLDRYQLSTDQSDAVAHYGYPASFSIFFYHQGLEQDLSFVRSETWEYPQSQVQLTFENGVLVATQPLPETILVAPAEYQPEQFDFYMDWQAAVNSLGLEELILVPLESSLVRDGELLFADRLVMGFKAGHLQYISALALVESQDVKTSAAASKVGLLEHSVPVQGQSRADRSPLVGYAPFDWDNAMLLLLAAERYLYDPPTDTTQAYASDLRLWSLAAQVPKISANEHRILRDFYVRHWENLPPDSPLRDHFLQKITAHDSAAGMLDLQRVRAAQRGRGLQNFVRRNIARPIGQALRETGKGVAMVRRVTLIIAKDELIRRVRQIVRRKIEELKQLVQGRIDLFWQRIANHLGVPVTELIRQMVVDPAFIRLRDRLAVQLGLRDLPVPATATEPVEDITATEAAATEEVEETEPVETEEPPTIPPPVSASDTPQPQITSFAGSWNSRTACDEAEDAPYTWGISLTQNGSQVTGSMYYHKCPGGGRAYYEVSGTATTAEFITLRAVKTGGRGDLNETTLPAFTFKIQKGKLPYDIH